MTDPLRVIVIAGWVVLALMLLAVLAGIVVSEVQRHGR